MNPVNKHLQDNSIAFFYHSSTEAFYNLAKEVLASKFSEYGTRFETQRRRFIAWGENAGAHRSDRMSLDHRLREASHIQSAVVHFCQDLITGLKEGSVNIFTEPFVYLGLRAFLQRLL